MAIQFILGTTGTGKTTAVFEQMKQQAVNMNKCSQIYIVPEQYTLQAQEEYLNYTKASGLLGIEVLSFNRLVARFYDELGLANHKPLDDVGISMLIRKILDDKSDSFVWLNKNKKNQNFVEEISGLIGECYQYNVTREYLDSVSEKVTEQLLKDKLQDISRLLCWFKEAMLTDYVTPQEAALKLIAKMETIEFLKEATVYIDGFYGFTPLQYQFIESLMLSVKDVVICITLPHDANHSDLKDDTELFFESKKMLSSLRRLMDQYQLREKEPLQLRERVRKQKESIRHLTDQLYRYPYITFQEKDSHIKLVEAMTIEQEVEVTALRIHQLVTEANYRYRDIVVLTSDLNDYEDEIQKAFAAYELSFFIDKKNSITEHPVIQCILSLLLVVQNNFRYEHVFYHLKSIYFEQQDEIAKIENYCLLRGIKGFKRFSAQWDEHNDIKNGVLQNLFDFHEKIKGDKSVKQKTKSLFNYIDKIKLLETNQRMFQFLSETNQLQEAKKYEKVYDLVSDMLDSIVNLIGDETITLKDFAGLIETGLQQIKFGQTPPSVDQILVGQISRSRFKEVKAVFVLGINEGKLPLLRSSETLLTDRERNDLLLMGLEVAPDQQKSLFKEQMNIFMALSRAKNLLHLSYARRNDEGVLRPATFFLTIQKLFPNHLVENGNRILDEMSTPTRAIPLFNRLARLATKENFVENEKEIVSLYNFFEKKYNKGYDLNLNPYRFIYGLDYENTTVQLDRMTKKDYLMSVSELETYASCPYQHYLIYRLRLNERQEYVVSLPDIGILFHQCLEIYIRKCLQRQLDISKVDVNVRNGLIEDSISELLQNEKYRIFTSTFQNQYLVVKLTRILKRSVWGIEHQLSKSFLRPKELEYQFDGKKLQLDRLTMKIEQTNMYLKGTVDRVDEYETEEALYYSILDYKSSNRDLDFNLIESGIQLQLFVYLDVIKEIKEHGTMKKIIPVGLYYYQIQDPFINIDKEEADDIGARETKEAKTESAMLRLLRPNGLVLHDESVIRLMDKEIDGTSLVLPVSITGKGISKNSSTITEEELDITLRHVRKKSEEAGIKIHQGDIPIAPYRYNQFKPCDYCEFKSVCRFDPSNRNEGYKDIRKISKEDVICSMKGEINGRSNKKNHPD